MKLFADYLAERSGQLLLSVEGIGFASYEINGEECYIVDIYIAKDRRKAGLASEFANKISEIARAQGCTYLKGTVDLRAMGARESALALLHYGFEPVHAQGDVIYFRKDF